MYQLVVFIEYFTIIGLFAECWVAFRNWSNKLHSYMFFYCVSNLVYNAGVLLELRSTTEEAYVVALKLGYMGRLWIGLSLFLFGAELCRIHVPGYITAVLALTHAFIYTLILDLEGNDLYYDYMEFVIRGDFPRLLHHGGPFYTVQTVMSMGYTVLGCLGVLYTFLRETNKMAKKRLMLILLAFASIGISYVVYIFKLVALAELYDVTTFGFAIGTIFMLIAIFKYKMLDAETVARNYVVDELSEGILVVDDEGRVSYHNKPAERLFPELAEQDVSGKKSEAVLERIRFAIYCDEPMRINEKIYTPRANSLIQNGTSVGVLYVLVDDSEHYRYMDELREQRQIADDANKAKSQFLANMSHEIRTPINAILGMGEMILRESKEKETVEYAEDIETSGQTLLALINDILDFSKVEEGKMEIIPVQYEPVIVKNDIVNMIKDRATKKGLKFEVEFDKEIPRLLRGDEIRIKQCALNLLTNAVKYTQEGEVRLKIRHRKSSDDRIVLSFEVSDTGVGIRPEDMDNLFSPFMRIDEKKNRSIEGTGLGISITKRLLELMKSDLHVESEYGKGSVFSFEIEQEVLNWEPAGEPERKADGVNKKKAEYKELFHAPEATILVVDDIKMNLTVFTKLLKKTQIQIDTALSGKLAIEMAKDKNYDIIFIDHLMPDMDGIETLEKLKEDNPDSNAVYIALTANAISGAREMYLNAGFADYISKPVEGPKLEKLIMSYLPPEKLLDTPISV